LARRAQTKEARMSFLLPTLGTPAREACGDISALAEILNPANAARLPDFHDAVRSARRNIATMPEARALFVICLRGDDERWLIRVGRRGGWKRVWNFGSGH
jgi:hypothetical protein